MKFYKLIPTGLILTVLCGCAANIGSNQYDTQQTGTVNRAVRCSVLSVRQINVENSGDTGTLIGAAAGGVAGSAIGGSTTSNILGAIGGAVIGGMAGGATEAALSKQGGFEYVAQLENGNIVTITQGNDVLLTPGQKCLILYGKKARIIPYNGI